MARKEDADRETDYVQERLDLSFQSPPLPARLLVPAVFLYVRTCLILVVCGGAACSLSFRVTRVVPFVVCVFPRRLNSGLFQHATTGVARIGNYVAMRDTRADRSQSTQDNR